MSATSSDAIRIPAPKFDSAEFEGLHKVQLYFDAEGVLSTDAGDMPQIVAGKFPGFVLHRVEASYRVPHHRFGRIIGFDVCFGFDNPDSALLFKLSMP